MDEDLPSSTPRKHRFAPKVPPQRRTRSSIVPKIEKGDDKDDVEAKKKLLQRFSELGNSRQRLKVDNNVPVQAIFMHGAKQSGTSWAPNVPQDRGLKRRGETDSMELNNSVKQSVSKLSIVGPSVTKESSDASVPKTKEYREPWNYAHTYYPTTLPLRRPYSGNPDNLNEAEFGEAAMKMEYNEISLRRGAELGLLNLDETSENTRLLFFQIPSALPAIKQSATSKGEEIVGNSEQLGNEVSMNSGTKESLIGATSQRRCSLEELSAGQMGKLLVYRSGAVKLKLGEVLYNVSDGENCCFAQEVVAINTQGKVCCSIGNLEKRAIVSLDTEYLLKSI